MEQKKTMIFYRRKRVLYDVDEEYLSGLEALRNDAAKSKRQSKPSKLRDVSRF